MFIFLTFLSSAKQHRLLLNNVTAFLLRRHINDVSFLFVEIWQKIKALKLFLYLSLSQQSGIRWEWFVWFMKAKPPQPRPGQSNRPSSKPPQTRSEHWIKAASYLLTILPYVCESFINKMPIWFSVPAWFEVVMVKVADPTWSRTLPPTFIKKMGILGERQLFKYRH